MASVVKFEPGGYRYVAGVFQYSGGVAAEPGFRLRRVRFREPVKLVDGFAAAERIMKAAGRARRSPRVNCARLRPSPRRASRPST